jgi:hypothetical protein
MVDRTDQMAPGSAILNDGVGQMWGEAKKNFGMQSVFQDGQRIIPIEGNKIETTKSDRNPGNQPVQPTAKGASGYWLGFLKGACADTPEVADLAFSKFRIDSAQIR